MQLRPLAGAFIYGVLIALFTVPSAPVASLIPTVGGLAYAEDCDPDGSGWHDCPPEPTREPEPIPEPIRQPPLREPCRGDSYPCARDLELPPITCENVVNAAIPFVFIGGVGSLATNVGGRLVFGSGTGLTYAALVCGMFEDDDEEE